MRTKILCLLAVYLTEPDNGYPISDMKKKIFYSLCCRPLAVCTNLLTLSTFTIAITLTTGCATAKQGETAEPATTPTEEVAAAETTVPASGIADEATIVGVYENCIAESSTIFLGPGRVEPTRAENIVAQAEAAGEGKSFEQALPLMIASLERNGIKNILVEKQGHCDVGGRGKYVEAIAGYCGEQLASAELFVDGTVFFRQTGPELVLEDFISEARKKLNSAGILTNPRVSINNLPDCPQQTTTS